MAATILLADLDDAWLRRTFFHGVPLTDPNGNDMAPETTELFVATAIGEWERYLDLAVVAEAGIVETHDYDRENWSKFSHLRLHRRPVRAVSAVDIMYGVTLVYSFPVDWIRVYSVPGQLNLFPSLGSLASPLAIGSVQALVPTLQATSWAPHVIRVTYDAGWAGDAIPVDLALAIGMTAALSIFVQLSDIAFGAGIASLSLGLDGLSQSLGTTASAMFGTYSARIEEYRKRLFGSGQSGDGGLVRALRSRYRPPVVALARTG